MTPFQNSSSASHGVSIRDANVKQTMKALHDLSDGFRHWELWGTLGWHDIRQRYRRSSLGPFWLTISMGMMVGGLGVLYGGLLRQPLSEYLPHLALGLIAWGLISGIVNDGCQTFIAGTNIIKQQASPFSIHVFRTLWRDLIVFFHNMVIYVAVIALFRINPGFVVLLILPGLVLVYLNGIWISILLGLISVRFRDFPPIVTSAMQLIFFMTPIIWRPEQLPKGYAFIVDLNPFYYFIKVIRGPLLGQAPPLSTWTIMAAIAAVGSLGTFCFYVRFRRRIPYWV